MVYVRGTGKAEAIRIFEPICRREDAGHTLADQLERYHRALELYRNRQWEEADELFAALASEQPELTIYRLYRERIEELKEMPEDETWDGVYERQTK